jgi:hypothetical protein
MVKSESYKFTPFSVPSAPPQVKRYSQGAVIQEMERASNGSWFVVADVSFDVEMVDGRKITVGKRVRLRAAQQGKIPHPDPFGWKKAKRINSKRKHKVK